MFVFCFRHNLRTHVLQDYSQEESPISRLISYFKITTNPLSDVYLYCRRHTRLFLLCLIQLHITIWQHITTVKYITPYFLVGDTQRHCCQLFSSSYCFSFTLPLMFKVPAGTFRSIIECLRRMRSLFYILISWVLTLSQMLPTMFRPREIHNSTCRISFSCLSPQHPGSELENEKESWQACQSAL